MTFLDVPKLVSTNVTTVNSEWQFEEKFLTIYINHLSNDRDLFMWYLSERMHETFTIEL